MVADRVYNGKYLKISSVLLNGRLEAIVFIFAPFLFSNKERVFHRDG